MKQRACIDYKLHALVYEKCAILCRIIDDLVVEKETRKELRKKLGGLSEFLKYSYVTHLSDDSADPYHNMKYALKHGKFMEATRKSSCSECNRV